MRFLLCSVPAALAAMVISGVLLIAAPARSADVHGDDEGDRYVGTGGLLLPGTVGAATRRDVASCLGCQWRLASPCAAPSPGNPFSGSATCLAVVRGCPARAEVLRAWFQPSGGTWREVGLVCIDQAGPVTIARIGIEVRDRLERLVPAPMPVFQPRTGVLAQLPVVFDSGQHRAAIHEEFALSGAPVSLDATPQWQWDFGDGATLDTRSPGGTYPDLSVGHAFRVAGRYAVRLRTIWQAQYSVDGLGPFPVPEPVTQNAVIAVAVGEGRAVLAVRRAPWQ